MSAIYAATTSAITDREILNAERACAIAAEGMVVLSNNGILPISADNPIALFGNGARFTIKGGTGSGDVNSRSVVNVETGLKEAGFTLLGEAWSDRLEIYANELHDAYNKRVEENFKRIGLPAIMEVIDHPFLEPPAVPLLDEELGLCDTAVYVVGRNSGEASDRHAVPGDFYLTDLEIENLNRVTAAYAHTIVILNVGGVIDTSYFRNNPKIDALLLMSQAGNNSGKALAAVLTGAIEPGGRLTTTWAKSYDDYPSSKTFSHCNGDTDDEYYHEGIYVGYRYFDTFGVEPAYPFGYGLGYTTFALSDSRASVKSNIVSVTTHVTNTGTRSGRHVVQIYVSAPTGLLEKPYQELKAYAKTKLLAPGESQLLTASFAVESLASYDTASSAWILEAGDYILRVGAHSRDTHPAAVLQLDRTVKTLQAKSLLALDEQFDELSAKGAIPYHYEGEAAEIAAAPVIKLDPAAIQCRTITYSQPMADLPPVVSDSRITLQEVLEGRYSIPDLVSQLSVEEMAELCNGTARGFGGDSIIGNSSRTVPGAAGDTSSIIYEERGVRNLVLADGPAGLRLTREFAITPEGKVMSAGGTHNGLDFMAKKEDIPEGSAYYYQYATAIPIATLLAQTWDDALIEEAGNIVGEEMELFGADLWLAPGMNIQRNPLCGRNFEYYSEDPLLTGRCAAADTNGVQKHKGGTTIKHFAFNNQEDNRLHSNSHVSERAAREIYLKGFEIAIALSQPKAMMSSYNLVNGTHTANSYDLLTSYARDEFGFKGVIMTDWGTTGSLAAFTGVQEHKYPDADPALCVKAGNDLNMPGSQADVDGILNAIKDGSLTLGELQACVIRVIDAVIKCS